MNYTPNDYHALFGIPGFSDRLLQDHFFLYRGYVVRTNMLEQMLRDYVREGKTETAEFNELKRRFAWEFNGMRLHEYYFGGMTRENSPLAEDSILYKKIVEDFGTYSHWEAELEAVASIRGIGWAILFYDSVGNRLHNMWVNEHDQGHLTGATPILVLDVFEHAYLLNYGVKKGRYIEVFLGAVDWVICIDRFEACSRRVTL